MALDPYRTHVRGPSPPRRPSRLQAGRTGGLPAGSLPIEKVHQVLAWRTSRSPAARRRRFGIRPR